MTLATLDFDFDFNFDFNFNDNFNYSINDSHAMSAESALHARVGLNLP